MNITAVQRFLATVYAEMNLAIQSQGIEENMISLNWTNDSEILCAGQKTFKELTDHKSGCINYHGQM